MFKEEWKVYLIFKKIFLIISKNNILKIQKFEKVFWKWKDSKLIKIIKLTPNKIGNKKFKFEIIYNSYIVYYLFFLKFKKEKNSN